MIKRTNTEKYCFDDELISLKENLLKMANAVEKAINLAIESLIKQRVDLADQVIQNDDVIDDMELDIEEQCLQMIALRQPIAKRLRIIGCGYKTVSDLERVGDQAVNIARASKYLATKDLVKPFIDLPRMARIAQNMLKDGLEAYFTGDVELAKRSLVKGQDSR